MDEDDDLDADLALFETQIQRVKAATKPPEPPQNSSSQLVSKHEQPTKPSKPLPPVSSPNQQNIQHATRTTTKTQPAIQQPQPPNPSQTATATPPTQPIKSTGRWFWDGTTWRWRTTPTLTKPATTPVPAPSSSTTPPPLTHRKSTKRTAAGEVWNDPTLAEWPSDDHRIFVGDLAPDATDKHLSDAFGVYPSFNMARIVRDKRSGACRGYGFVSFADGRDMVQALRELNGKYVGGRPVKLKRSNWQKRSLKGEKWKELKAFQRIAKK